MKVILHMGSAKTGTTSLQAGLDKIRPQLRQAGFHVPEPRGRLKDYHHVLLGLLERPDAIGPRKRKRYGSFDETLRTAIRFVSDARSDAEASGCHTVVLSTELIYSGSREELFRLRDRLGELSTDIQPVVYVREPASLYKSQLQQRAKRLSFRRPEKTAWIRERYGIFEEIFGRKPVVRAFDRAQLTGGDILDDFCIDVLGLDHLKGKLPRIERNTSLSAETTRALLHYGDFLEDIGKDRSDKAVDVIRKSFTRFEDRDGILTRLRLKPEVVSAVRRSAEDYFWLRDEYGISFPELDYDAIHADHAKELERFDSPEDVFDWDEKKLAWLLLSVMYDMHGASRPGRADTEEANEDDPSAAGPRPAGPSFWRRLFGFGR